MGYQKYIKFNNGSFSFHCVELHGESIKNNPDYKPITEEYYQTLLNNPATLAPDPTKELTIENLKSIKNEENVEAEIEKKIKNVENKILLEVVKERVLSKFKNLSTQQKNEVKYLIPVWKSGETYSKDYKLGANYIWYPSIDTTIYEVIVNQPFISTENSKPDTAVLFYKPVVF